MGRHSEFTQEIADIICERISDGESLRAICAEENMPNKATVFRWLASNNVFSDQYARARECQADVLADEILDIADDGSNDWMEKYGKDGEKTGWQVNGEAVQRSRLRLDARKWLAGKLRPKKYGEKVEQTIQGPEGAPVQSEVTIRFIRPDGEVSSS